MEEKYTNVTLNDNGSNSSGELALFGVDDYLRVPSLETDFPAPIQQIVADLLAITPNKYRCYLLGLPIEQEYMSFMDYKKFRNEAHDILHHLHSLCQGYPTRERRIRDIFDEPEDESLRMAWSLVSKQTPDVVVVGDTVVIREFTVSVNRDAYKYKEKKYALLVYLLRQMGMQVHFKAITCIQDYRFIEEMPEIGMDHLYVLRKVIQAYGSLLTYVHNDPLGMAWRQEFEGIDLKPSIVFGEEWDRIKAACDELDNVPYDDNDFDEIVNPYSEAEDEETVRTVLEDIRTLVMVEDQGTGLLSDDRKDSHFHWNRVNDQLIERALEYEDSNPDQPKRPARLLKIPVLLDTPGERCSVDKDGKMFDSLVSGRTTLGISYTNNMSKYCDLTEIPRYIRREWAIQGPGRKAYMARGDMDCILAAKRRSGETLNPTQELLDLDELIYHMNHESNSFSYLRFLEMVYRELTLNSQRPQHSKQLIKTMVSENVGMIIFPGAKLRTGNSTGTVWFKLFIEGSLLNNEQIKPVEYSNLGLHETMWLSANTHQVNHYLRCKSKVRMAYESYKESTFLKEDLSNTLGLMTLTFVENKRKTSSFIQDVRFIIMQHLSVVSQFGALMDRFNMPIRSTMQMYYWNRIGFFTETADASATLSTFKMGSASVNPVTGAIDDSKAGSVNLIPRALTSGPAHNFRGALSEMYFCMLFNKNADDPTHSSFSLLEKILWGENKYRHNKALHKDNFYGRMGVFSAWKNRGVGVFCKDAVKVGGILANRGRHARRKGIHAFQFAASRSNINKTLDDFATFKSSVDKTMLRNKYDSEMPFTRKKCLVTVCELISEGLMNSNDVLMKHAYEFVHFEVFKKAQVGGVREILILDISSRVRINIVESFFRALCKNDDREMLSSGKEKFFAMRDISRLHYVSKGKGRTFYFNMDKSKWGPRIATCMFIWTVSFAGRSMPDIVKTLYVMFSLHHNKVLHMPKELMDAWISDPMMFIRPDNDDVCAMKDKFLTDLETFFTNESSMGQGIYHFTSSYAHCCMMSLLEDSFDNIIQHTDLSQSGWRMDSLISSDDSEIWLTVDFGNVENNAAAFVLFNKCMDVTETMFGFKTSPAKSCVSTVVQEFNSAFSSALTFYPTLMKFALSSTPVPKSDSYYDAVNECYSCVKAMRDNGGSSTLAQIANEENKEFLDHMFNTSEMRSKIEDFGIRWKNVPYHLGRFPEMDPDLFYMYGPRMDSYLLFTEMQEGKMNHMEEKLFRNSHRYMDRGTLALSNGLIDPEELTNSIVNIRISAAPSSMAEKIRKELPYSKEDLNEYILNNPLFVFMKPQTTDEVMLKVCMRMNTPGADLALRSTDPILYYMRTTSVISAKAYKIRHEDEGRSFSECVDDILGMPEQKEITDVYMELIFPDHQDMKRLGLELRSGDVDPSAYKIRNPFETMMIRKLKVRSEKRVVERSFADVLMVKWGNMEVPKGEFGSYERSFRYYKDRFPMLEDSLHLTKERFLGTEEEKIRAVLVLLNRANGDKSDTMKVFCYGHRTEDPAATLEVLRNRNKFADRTMKLYNYHLGNDTVQTTNTSRIKYILNLIVSELHQGRAPENLGLMLADSNWRDLMSGNLLSMSSRKLIILVLLHYRLIEMSELERLTESIGITLSNWTEPQRKYNGNYQGYGRISMMHGGVYMDVTVTGKKGHPKLLEIQVSPRPDPFKLKQMFNELRRQFNMQPGQEFALEEKGAWIESDDTVAYARLGRRPVGYRISQVNIAAVFEYPMVVMSESRMTAVNSAGRRMFSCNMRTYYTNFCEDLGVDFFGFPYACVAKYGVMHRDFSQHIANMRIRDANEILQMASRNYASPPFKYGGVSNMFREAMLSDGWGVTNIPVTQSGDQLYLRASDEGADVVLLEEKFNAAFADLDLEQFQENIAAPMVKEAAESGLTDRFDEIGSFFKGNMEKYFEPGTDKIMQLHMRLRAFVITRARVGKRFGDLIMEDIFSRTRNLEAYIAMTFEVFKGIDGIFEETGDPLGEIDEEDL